jgi:hypothetical protein
MPVGHSFDDGAISAGGLDMADHQRIAGGITLANQGRRLEVKGKKTDPGSGMISQVMASWRS